MMNTIHLRYQQHLVKRKVVKAANSRAIYLSLQFGLFSSPDTVQQLLLLELETKLQETFHDVNESEGYHWPDSVGDHVNSQYLARGDPTRL